MASLMVLRLLVAEMLAGLQLLALSRRRDRAARLCAERSKKRRRRSQLSTSTLLPVPAPRPDEPYR